MKRKVIKALIIGTAVASTISIGANDGIAMASEKNKEEVSIGRTIEDKDYSGFYRGDMSGGDAALGLDKVDVPTNYSELEAKATPTINGIKVSKQLIDINYSKGVEITPKYIVIHDTDNRRAGADAQANRDYFANHPNANASAHYIVDQGNIIQALEDTWRGWHVGDGGASAEVNNSNGIGIELAVNAGNDFDKTFQNGVALTRYLMQKYNIPAENIVMHKHASGKTCSRMMIEDRPNLWAKFKEEVAKGMPGENKIIDGKSPISTGTLVNVNSYINIRQKPEAYSTVVSKLYKNAKVQIYGEENGFYKVSYMEKEKGYGYVSKDYVKVDNGVDIPEEKPVEKPETPGAVIKIGKVINVTTSLNVRSGAGTNYSSIGSLKANETVKITGESGNWYKIDFNGRVGYVSKDYVKVEQNVETPKPEDKPVEKPETPGTVIKIGKVINVTTSLNVRSGAGTNYSSIGSLKANETVKITGESGNWYKIDFNGRVGYVSKDYVKVEQNVETPKPEDKPVEKPETPGTVIKTGKVINVTTSLNVRSGAGTNYSSIGSLKANETVKITGESGNWYKIDFNGRVGYVSKDFIKVEQNIETPKPEDKPEQPKPENKPEVVKTGQVINVTTSLNVRSGAGTNYSSIGSLKANATVKITGESGNWYKIDFNGRVGYVSKDYIKVNTSTSDTVKPEQPKPENKPETPSVEVKTGQVINVTTSLNVRSGAGTNYSSIGSLKANATVKVTGESGNWYKIDFNGRVGYVSKDYIKVNTSTSDTVKPEQPKPENKPETPSVEVKTGQVVGISSVLNVRAGAGTNHSVIGSLKPSQSVKITGESGNWYKIDFNGRVGYVSKDYIKVNTSTSDNVKPEEKPETPSQPTTLKDGKVTGISTSLNVRSGAGTNHSIIGSLKPNQSVKITGESGSWYKIDLNGKIGYVSKQYVTIISGGNSNSNNNVNNVIGTVYNITTKLNVRNSPSTSAGIIGSLYDGNKVEITGETGNWYKININGKVGYVSKDFVRK